MSRRTARSVATSVAVWTGVLADASAGALLADRVTCKITVAVDARLTLIGVADEFAGPIQADTAVWSIAEVHALIALARLAEFRRATLDTCAH